MTFDKNKFTIELHDQFKDSLSIEEVEELISLNESYSKDTPLSTGKNLVITNISFQGEKIGSENQDYSGQIIDYTQKIETGINIWIADNLKGKSSVLKIIKYALTGRNSIKPNVKKWIKYVFLNFSIGNKDYTIHLNMGGRLQASLYNGTIKTITELDEYDQDALILSKSESEYEIQIQDFFFNQFSYYSLKWTQKNSSKDSNDLLEVDASWSTYFKSIFLESKDSNSLMYGDQGKKVFQMLMGLELTYPINQLSIKKDMLNDKKAKQKLFSENETKKQITGRSKLVKNLEMIDKKITEYKQQSAKKININELYTKYNSALDVLKKENEKSLKNENEIQSLRKTLLSSQQKRSSNEVDISKLKKEIDKNEKRIADLSEYLEIGIFFSNLDIKHCPNCDHEISEIKKKTEVEEHKCALCNEGINHSEVDLDKDIFNEKIENLKNTNNQLAKDMATLTKDIGDKQIQYEDVYKKIVILEQQKDKIKDTSILNKELKEIEEKINTEKEKTLPTDSKKDKLIIEKAIIEYQIAEIDKAAEKSGNATNYDKQIEVLSFAITELNSMRFDTGQRVLMRLEELMLNEIHEFGLKSITEINITDKFDILYKQDGDFISFDHIAEGEQLRAKIAFYLSLILLDIEYSFGRHTRLLMIDSPSKEEGDANYLEGLSNVLKSIQSRYGEELQILIGTAERGLNNIVKNEYVTPLNTYLF